MIFVNFAIDADKKYNMQKGRNEIFLRQDLFNKIF